MAGRLEREQRGRRWIAGSWSRRGDRYVWQEGTWEEEPARTKPPIPKAERYVAKPGPSWVSGPWEWKGGAWTWLSGHYENEQPGKTDEPGHWEHKDGDYYWRPGYWR